MTEQFSSRWWTSMLKKHGSEEAVRKFMRESGAKAQPTDKPKGFAHDKAHGKDKHIKEMSRKALEARWGSKRGL